MREGEPEGSAEARESQRGSGRGRRNDGEGTAGVPAGELAASEGAAFDRHLSAAAGEAGGDTEIGRRHEKARHPDGGGSIRTAGGAAGAARALGPHIQRTQLRVQAGAVGPSGGGEGARIYPARLRLGRGP